MTFTSHVNRELAADNEHFGELLREKNATLREYERLIDGALLDLEQIRDTLAEIRPQAPRMASQDDFLFLQLFDQVETWRSRNPERFWTLEPPWNTASEGHIRACGPTLRQWKLHFFPGNGDDGAEYVGDTRAEMVMAALEGINDWPEGDAP